MKTLAFFLAVSLVSPAAWAQPSGDKATAQTLFDRGLKLLEAKKHDEACPLLAESHRLDPAQGTLFRLATCLEAQGKHASAWAAFVEVAEAAKSEHKADRERVARQRADALASKLAHLTIKSADADVEIRRDGAVVSKTLRGQETPVDPGSHKITATREGSGGFETTLKSEPGEKSTVEVPALVKAADKGPPLGTPLANPAPSAFPAAPPAPLAETTQPTRRTVGLVVGGVGVVALIGSGVAGLLARSKRDESVGHCRGNLCDPTGLDLRDAALTRATVGTVLGIVGGVGIVAGGTLWLTGKPSSTAVGTDGQRLLLRGAF